MVALDPDFGTNWACVATESTGFLELLVLLFVILQVSFSYSMTEMHTNQIKNVDKITFIPNLLTFTSSYSKYQEKLPRHHRASWNTTVTMLWCRNLCTALVTFRQWCDKKQNTRSSIFHHEYLFQSSERFQRNVYYSIYEHWPTHWTLGDRTHLHILHKGRDYRLKGLSQTSYWNRMGTLE